MKNTPVTIEQRMVTVVYLDEKVKVMSSPQSFSDFNGWVRSRFGLTVTDKISFKNITGAEIIPSAMFFCKEDYIEVISENKDSQKIPDKLFTGNVLGPMAPPAALNPDTSSDFFWYYGAPSLILLIAMCLAPQSGEYLDYFIAQGHFGSSLAKQYRRTIVECYVSFLCWSSTYLFVRRLLNPETNPVVFKKFSADAFYGGLAAASTAFIKPILTAALQTS